MKKFMIKSLVIIMMCAIVFSYAAVTASAVNIVTYSDRCDGLFSCNLKGDIEGTTGYYRAMAKTTRLTNAEHHILARAFIEYTDDSYDHEIDFATTLSSVTVLIESAVVTRVACGVSSFHAMYDGQSASHFEVSYGFKWLGYKIHEVNYPGT